jgi:hypothetical protein
MKIKFKKDARDKLWAELELKIQKGSKNKDKNFNLNGKWKKFLRRQGGFKVFSVDGEWIRNNLSVIFGHGGHGYVHEFIPLDEIWIATHHFGDCGCSNVKKDKKVSQQYFDSTTIHEITEFKLMEKGKKYWEAHQLSLQKEIDAGILKNPHREID